MYHSITFGDKNSYDDWHLVSKTRPLFNPPSLKAQFTDVPGMSGSLDYTESLTGYPVFENREGSLEFFVLNDYGKWYTRYSEIMNYLHGKKLRAILEDDPTWYYEGRFTVNEWKSEKDRSSIVIDYSVYPYKLSTIDSTEKWLWDPFNFEEDIIKEASFNNIEVHSNDWKLHEYTKLLYGDAPVCPEIIVESINGLDFWFINRELNINAQFHLPSGRYKTPDIILYGSKIQLYVKGDGKFSLEFTSGRL